MTQPDRLTIEDVESLDIAGDHYLFIKKNGKNEEVYLQDIAQHLADTMRENDLLRLALEQITGKLPYGFLIAGESKSDALGRILDRIQEIASQALSNKDTE